MSTPQDPRNSGETPRHHGETPEPHGETPAGNTTEGGGAGPHEPTSGGQPPHTPEEPFVAPGAPQPPDDTQTPDRAPRPPDESAAAGAPQPPSHPDRGADEPWYTGTPQTSGGPTPGSSDDPPTEYLPKLLGRDSGAGRSGETGRPSSGPESGQAGSPADDHPTHLIPKQPGEPGDAGTGAPRLDKGTAAHTHGWQPGAPEQPSGDYPAGEVPPQAWSARPEEQSPGQAWQPQSPGQQPGYPQGGTPYPSAGGYGGPPGGPAEQTGWGAPGAQSGWGAPGGQQGWGAPGGQPAWGGTPAGQPDQSGQQPPGGYPAYPQQQYQPYGATQQPERSGPQVLSIIGFVCAAVSLLFCPLVFGVAGIILGVVGHIRGESLGKWAAIAAAVCLVIGIVLVFALSGMDMVPIESMS
jgi:hypothetical protein